jgi:hypothetical protein
MIIYLKEFENLVKFHEEVKEFDEKDNSEV